MIIQRELLIAVGAIVISDGLAFAWLWDMRSKRKKQGSSESIPFSTLILALLVMCFAHYLGLNMVWQYVSTLDTVYNMTALLVIVSILPAIPPTFLFVTLMVERLSESSVDGAMGMGTARRQETDFSRAKYLASQGNIDGAVAEYRKHFKADPTSARPLFMAYRLLYMKGNRDVAANILREIMRSFDDDPKTWAQAATELANYLQNDKRETESARRILHQIIRKAPRTEYGRLAHGRLAGTWDSGEREIEL